MVKFIEEGSVKKKFRIDKETIAFKFTSHFSAFDVGRASYTIPGKAEAVCACAVKSFEIAEKIGIPTHFVEQIDEITIRIKEAQIITHRLLAKSDENYIIPAEWIYRLRVAGSIHRDFVAGRKLPEDYGLPTGIVPNQGTLFPYPVHQFTTKFEKTDQELTDEIVCKMTGITLKDMDEYWSMIDRLTGAMALVMQEAGFTLFDGKFECIMGPNRQKIIGDVFGTPDEDRPCLTEALPEISHYSKEFIRQRLIEMGYYEKLLRCRKKSLSDPPIPKFSNEEIAEISRRYVAFTEAYTGKRLSF